MAVGPSVLQWPAALGSYARWYNAQRLWSGENGRSVIYDRAALPLGAVADSRPVVIPVPRLAVLGGCGTLAITHLLDLSNLLITRSHSDSILWTHCPIWWSSALSLFLRPGRYLRYLCYIACGSLSHPLWGGAPQPRLHHLFLFPLLSPAGFPAGWPFSLPRSSPWCLGLTVRLGLVS